MPRPTNPILTDWEMKLMDIIWEKDTVTAKEIQYILFKQKIVCSDSAIRKTLRVLETKGVLKHSREEKAYIYMPAVVKRSIQSKAIQHLENIFFRGSGDAMFLKMVEDTDISDDAISEMRRILEEKKKDE